MAQDRIKAIRAAERKSHTDIYTSAALFAQGSWLSKPVKTVTGLLPYFDGVQHFRGLDLGCGIGRNCIPVAQYLQGTDCILDCVDILDIAIAKLEQYSRHYQVDRHINGITMALEDFPIAPRHYDLILAVSSLEHVKSQEAFCEMLERIQNGVRENGIVCFVINSNVTEVDTVTGEALCPQFEVNLPTDKLSALLRETYSGWEIIKHSVRPQQYDIPRENLVRLSTDVVTWVARKTSTI